MDHELSALIDLGIRDFRPVEDLQVFAGIEERKDLEAKRSEDDVGMARAAEGEAKTERGEGQGNERPPPGRERILWDEVEDDEGGRGPAGDRSDEGEEGRLRTAGEAQFLVGFGNILGAGEHCIQGTVFSKQGSGIGGNVEEAKGWTLAGQNCSKGGEEHEGWLGPRGESRPQTALMMGERS